MPRSSPRVLLAARTAAERQRQRAGIRLRDFSITSKTRERYEKALGRLIPFLESQEISGGLDGIICDWVEAQWARGESIAYIADALSGLHFFWPELKGTLRHAWRLFKNWRRIESPTEAPPMTLPVIRALLGRAVTLGDLPFAVMLALGFHCLLRTGELMAAQFQDLEFNQTCGVLSLKASKSGLRTGSNEAVSIRDPITLQLLDIFLSVQSHSPGNTLWPWSPQAFRNMLRCYASISSSFESATWILNLIVCDEVARPF